MKKLILLIAAFALSCSDDTPPTSTTPPPANCIPTAGGIEICDGIDNDCDGQVDEGYDVGRSCTAGEGECEVTGVTVCDVDKITVVCDAMPDPMCGMSTCEGDIGEPCTNGEGECATTGTLVCDAADLVCDAPDPGVMCDGACQAPAFFESTENCGTCDNACEVGQICEGGECVCPTNEALCEGSCKPASFFISNTDHCGTCENSCNASCGEDTCVDAVAVTGGFTHTCALMADKTVRCWGANNFGQLGNNTLVPSEVPVVVAGLSDVEEISSGSNHTCARLSNGTVSCWGANFFGKLGDGTKTNRPAPVAVSGLQDITQISAGADHTCALTTGRLVYCWGQNFAGQLGDATFDERTTPVAVVGLISVTQISAGGSHTCGRRSNNQVACWGRNTDGQLGDGTTTGSPMPIPIPSASNNSFRKVVAGGSHTCAQTTTGTIKCWGDNSKGQLGDGTTNPSLTPRQISGVTDVRDITAGESHNCLEINIGARCWGYNEFGQIGDQSDLNRLLPVSPVGLGLGTATNFSAHGLNTCAVVEGNVYCWGHNDSSQIGDRTTDNALAPTPVIW